MAIEMIAIVGPTASGKTRHAVNIASRLGSEIISADSRQVYRGMTIGTGKDLEEYGNVPYHLIDVCDAGENYRISSTPIIQYGKKTQCLFSAEARACMWKLQSQE